MVRGSNTSELEAALDTQEPPGDVLSLVPLSVRPMLCLFQVFLWPPKSRKVPFRMKIGIGIIRDFPRKCSYRPVTNVSWQKSRWLVTSLGTDTGHRIIELFDWKRPWRSSNPAVHITAPRMRHIGTIAQSLYLLLNIHCRFECPQCIFLIFPTIFDDSFLSARFWSQDRRQLMLLHAKCSRLLENL